MNVQMNTITMFIFFLVLFTLSVGGVWSIKRYFIYLTETVIELVEILIAVLMVLATVVVIIMTLQFIEVFSGGVSIVVAVAIVAAVLIDSISQYRKVVSARCRKGGERKDG